MNPLSFIPQIGTGLSRIREGLGVSPKQEDPLPHLQTAGQRNTAQICFSATWGLWLEGHWYTSVPTHLFLLPLSLEAGHRNQASPLSKFRMALQQPHKGNLRKSSYPFSFLPRDNSLCLLLATGIINALTKSNWARNGFTLSYTAK